VDDPNEIPRFAKEGHVAIDASVVAHALAEFV
jgi:hypothetical protein